METEYSFRVAAVNCFGIGEFSDETIISTGIPYTAPSMKSAPIVSSVKNRVLL